ncbi:PAS domain S-box-containing protein [Bradyrhizobium erythrophlei]|uniref:histidine kinase n=1 Tax=Bradyrhizobium erythrophlei TaxID=1437360 RepID=A0A1M7UCP1_9BRAD|nr:PAS domain S-box-containing protein [Bradyrhizobium erythrophlei]
MIRQALERSAISSVICDSLVSLHDNIQKASGGLIVTEESLTGTGLDALLDWFARQPPWSDLPIIALATKQVGHRSAGSSDLLRRLGNVVLLERPINAETLASAARSVLRARKRQYQVESLLEEQKRTAVELRALNDTLEQRVEQRTSELNEARDTLAFALDSAEMGSWDFDLVHDSARRTLRHDQIFGYKDLLPSWSTRQFLAHIADEDRQAAETALEKAAQSGSFEIECRVNRRDGKARWIAAKGRVGYDASRRPIRMAGILMDITDRKQTEAALHKAQRMEAIGQLTGGVAHDFNNLLTVIVGGLDMVIRRPDQPERVARLAQAAMTAARRGEQLTQQLLAYSRRQMLHPETLNPNRLLLDFKGLAERAVGDSITLRFDLDAGIHPIRVDAAQLESAILNLVVNSRDAMPQGGTISITSKNVHCGSEAVAEKGVSPGAYVQISVTDEGTGIDQNTLDHVFEPFFTTKEVGKGSGLGLAQVYGFIRSAGGYVAIKSKKGRGTTVQLFLPRSDERLSESHLHSSGQLPLRRAATGETVLLVEDDEQVLNMAVESLEELQYRVVVARDARQALDHLHGTERIDIMFSDVVMPGGMNGAQLAVEARALRPDLKVLLTSGYVGEGGDGEFYEKNLPVLSKPYRRDELAEKLRLVLGSH